MNGIDHAIEDDKRRFISIVIFQALGKTYKEDATRLFSAKFLHSAHYVVNNPFPREGFIDGFFSSESVDLDLSSIKSEIEDSSSPELVYLSCPLVLFFIILLFLYFLLHFFNVAAGISGSYCFCITVDV